MKTKYVEPSEEMLLKWFDYLSKEDKENWSLDRAKALMRDQYEYEVWRGWEPNEYDPEIAYNFIAEVIAAFGIEDDDGEFDW